MPQKKLIPGANPTAAVAPISAAPQAPPSALGAISEGYVSPDVIDLRNAQPSPFMDKIRGLWQSVKDDYHDSFPAPAQPAIFGPGNTIPAVGQDAATSPAPFAQPAKTAKLTR